MSRLIIVSNRVPLPNKNGHMPAGGLGTALHAALKKHGGIWFGWSGKEQTENAYSLKSLNDENIHYVLLDLPKKDIRNYYDGFSNRVLWPLCHYRLDLIQYDQESLLSYLHVNRIFAEKLLPLLKNDDILWIHDYHLIPLASELRQRGVKNSIGFFHHIPWPSWDILSTLPIYEILLRGMTSYDLLGFQTKNDVENFAHALKQSALGMYHQGNLYSSAGFFFKADAFPIGIDADNFEPTPMGTEFEKALKHFCFNLQDKDLIIGVDRLDYSKGILQRLQAYEYFLSQNKALHGRVTFLQLTPKSRSNVPEYNAMQKQVAQLAGEINGNYGRIDWMPIVYINQNLPHEILTHLYRMAKVALITPLRDGMNLVAKEYLAAQDHENPGTLILSRFAGAACELKGALHINPYDKEAISNALIRAISMDIKERKMRFMPMIKHLKQHNVQEWVHNFLHSLQK